MNKCNFYMCAEQVRILEEECATPSSRDIYQLFNYCTTCYVPWGKWFIRCPHCNQLLRKRPKHKRCPDKYDMNGRY